MKYFYFCIKEGKIYEMYLKFKSFTISCCVKLSTPNAHTTKVTRCTCVFSARDSLCGPLMIVAWSYANAPVKFFLALACLLHLEPEWHQLPVGNQHDIPCSYGTSPISCLHDLWWLTLWKMDVINIGSLPLVSLLYSNISWILFLFNNH